MSAIECLASYARDEKFSSNGKIGFSSAAISSDRRIKGGARPRQETAEWMLPVNKGLSNKLGEDSGSGIKRGSTLKSWKIGRASTNLEAQFAVRRKARFR